MPSDPILVFDVKAASSMDARRLVSNLLEDVESTARFAEPEVILTAAGFYEVRVSSFNPPIDYLEYRIETISDILSMRSV